MRNDEVIGLPGSDHPVLCADGKFGMLLIFPGKDGLCGVQVRGEEEHRWIASADLTATQGGALRQVGSPRQPPISNEIMQSMLSDDWTRRGGIRYL